ncbi:putative membrane protein YgcG [Roseateles asaccharophilus]|uniref:tetratricopeptide repeat protein n=1 Tax=Roseateles asaccharophilus TaxID=582607 RepID=UPI0038325631
MKKSIRSAALVIALIGAMAAAIAGPKEDIKADMLAGRWAQADERLVDVLEKHPDNALPHYWRAQVLEKMGRLAEAKQELDEAARRDPSEKFAGNKQQLAAMRERLQVATAASDQKAEQESATVAKASIPVQAQVAAPTPSTPAPAEEAATSSFNLQEFKLYVLIGAIVVMVVYIIFALRSKPAPVAEISSGGSPGESPVRARWKRKLEEHVQLLDQALKFSDGQPDLDQAIKLANYDQINSLKGLLNSRIAGLEQDQFEGLDAILMRAKDLAADITRQERPSEVRRREEEAAAARQHEVQMEAMRARTAQAAQQPVYVQNYSAQSQGPDLFTTAAVMGAGAMLASSAGADDRRRREEEEEERARRRRREEEDEARARRRREEEEDRARRERESENSRSSYSGSYSGGGLDLGGSDSGGGSSSVDVGGSDSGSSGGDSGGGSDSWS